MFGLAIGAFARILFAVLTRVDKRVLVFGSISGLAGLSLALCGSYFFVPDRLLSHSVIRIQPSDQVALTAANLRARAMKNALGGVSIQELRSPNAPGAFGPEIEVTSDSQTDAHRFNRQLFDAALRSDPAAVLDLDPPSYPQSPAYPNRLLIAALGLGLGVVSGGATARLRARAA